MDKRKSVSILDYGCGNLGSVAKMLEHIGVQYNIITSPDEVLESEILLLPGVGHFKTGMKNLTVRGLLDPLNKHFESGGAILGICLGMQLMTLRSEEGGEGLAWFDCETKKFPQRSITNERLIVPHMGWNHIADTSDRDLVKETDRFYFVHSYYVDAVESSFVLTTSSYGGHTFASAIQDKNLTGVQFHPEKSHQYGIAFLTNYFNREGAM